MLNRILIVILSAIAVATGAVAIIPSDDISAQIIQCRTKSCGKAP